MRCDLINSEKITEILVKKEHFLAPLGNSRLPRLSHPSFQQQKLLTSFTRDTERIFGARSCIHLFNISRHYIPWGYSESPSRNLRSNFMSGNNSSAPSLLERARSYVYDTAIVSLTTKWYLEVLQEIPENSHILDVGIGTGAALIANAATLRARNISVVGVDYDQAYVATCRCLIAEAKLERHVTVIHESIYDFTPRGNRLFNHVYFSGSFMILPQPSVALKKVVELLVDRQDGRIYFTQTFELKKNTFMEWLKPKLFTLTSIDFGRVSYEGDFEDAVHEAKLVIETSTVIDDGNKVEGVRESRLVCARSSLYVAVTNESAT